MYCEKTGFTTNHSIFTVLALSLLIHHEKSALISRVHVLFYSHILKVVLMQKTRSDQLLTDKKPCERKNLAQI